MSPRSRRKTPAEQSAETGSARRCAPPGASSTTHDRKRSCFAHWLDYWSYAMLLVVAVKTGAPPGAGFGGRAGSRRPLSPAVKKQPSTCRRGQPVTGRERAHCPVSASIVLPALGPPCCARTVRWLSHSGFPRRLRSTGLGLLLSPFDCLTRHPEQIPLWVARYSAGSKAS